MHSPWQSTSCPRMAPNRGCLPILACVSRLYRELVAPVSELDALCIAFIRYSFVS